MSFPYFGDMLIYGDELLTEYVLAICMLGITMLTVILSWKFSPKESTIPVKTPVAEPQDSEAEGLLTKMKRTRQEEISTQVTAGMSSEQLEEEKRIEDEQLAAIYSLLSKQGDKFNVGSMEEVQDQLKLYRP